MTALPIDGTTYSLEECPFETVMVDITHQCNMACHNCYIPNRTIPDLDRDWLAAAFRRLKPKRFVRLVGAEPTVRRDLPTIIRDVKEAGHHPVLMTNGLRLSDPAYVRDLKQAGVQVVYLSMNGAFDDDLYDQLDGLRCAGRKARAFDNLAAEHVFTSIGMIVVAECNRHAVAPLLEACRSARNVREFHLRSVGAIGRFMTTIPLDLDDMLGLFCDATGISSDAIDRRARTATSHDFLFERLRVQLTMWPDLGSSTRGRLTPEGNIVPFFEHLIANEGGY
ncbi:MAG TPA: radical SAM protein [Vicinamibacterales bacterium]|nr:radical SAM protein [Vicinamibacterales bacterium]